MQHMLTLAIVAVLGVVSSNSFAQATRPGVRIPQNRARVSVPQQRRMIPGEFIVSMKSQRGVNRMMAAGNSGELAEAKVMGISPRSGAVMKVKYRPTVNFATAANALARSADVAWVSPNYLYFGSDPRESTNDPMFAQQFHHPVMKNPEAWSMLRGGLQPVVVAVTDDGVDLSHEDLKNMISLNTKEIPGNGIDDDNNGYIDDVNGWNFRKNSNDPNPGSGEQHGTHVAGIIAAEPNNSKGVVGTASIAAKIMALKFYDGEWTSESVAKAYMYATDNGAKIISTSYNVDGFVGDKAFEAGIRYAYDKGVIHFNSAGNNNQENPKRTVFQELIFVCSTIADNQKNDVRSSFSNYGVLVHICSPGGDGAAGILATTPMNKYERLSGTSMATPNAAAVAALIWAKNPKWTRDQVVAQLLGTADNVDGKNPGFEGKLGTGRTNSVDALSKAPRKARFVGVFNRQPNGNLKDTSQVILLVQGIIAPASSNDLRHYRVVSAGADGQFGTSDDQAVPVKLAREVLYASRAIALKFDSNLKVGKYKVQVNGPKMADPFDQALEGFEQEFAVAAEGAVEAVGRWW